MFFLNRRADNGETVKSLISDTNLELEDALHRQARGCCIHANVQWAEEGEASNAYFFKLEQSKGQQRLFSHAFDQRCGVRGQNSIATTRFLQDVINNVNNHGLGGAILLLDQEKAFDQVDWAFLLRIFATHELRHFLLSMGLRLHRPVQVIQCFMIFGLLMTNQFFHLAARPLLPESGDPPA